MTTSAPGRRLAAILAADVVGYSRLMESGEERTLSALKAHRAEFFDPLVAQHGGRIFKVMGDGVLVEFASVVSAARCALDIQRGMSGRNAGLPEDHQIRFRIGLNLGDLIVEGEDVYGDGVNLAVRLEALAPQGGISCSEAVRAQIGNRLGIEFLDQGEKTVKNIAQPVHVHFLDIEGPAVRGPAAGRSDKPTIAVLPFANMSNDPEQEFFSDGITEDIITDLSKVSGLHVTSRNTVFSTKGKAMNLGQVARQLGVAYLLEGSVRKAGNRVRVTAQLIEGATDGHLWAERYDRDLTDIFAVQDEITQTIVAQLKVKLLPEEKSAIERLPTDNVEAYTIYLRGLRLLRHGGTQSGVTVANRMFSRAIELDPNFARAYAGMASGATTLLRNYGVGMPLGDILQLADRAIALQPDLAEAHATRGLALLEGGARQDAVAAFERALQIDPDSAESNYSYGSYFFAEGEFALAVTHFERALEQLPDDYSIPMLMSQALDSLGRRDEARDVARRGVQRAEAWLLRHPEDGIPAHMGAATLAFLGEAARARDGLPGRLKSIPKATPPATMPPALMHCSAIWTAASTFWTSISGNARKSFKGGSCTIPTLTRSAAIRAIPPFWR